MSDRAQTGSCEQRVHGSDKGYKLVTPQQFEMMQDRENIPKQREIKPCTERRGFFRGEYKKNSIHTPKQRQKLNRK